MKILVCISKSPDTTARIAFKNNDTEYEEAGVQWIINPYDEWYALVKAIELKEQNPAAVIHIVHVGLPDSDAIIRKALALGGDEASRINAQPADAYFTASQIAAFAKERNYNLILTGKETINYNSSAVGSILATLLDVPYVSLATSLAISSNSIVVNREVEGGSETSEVILPAVVSCQKGMAEQRIPNMRGIMAARTKPLAVLEPIIVESLTNVVKFSLPAQKKGLKTIDVNNLEELLKLLHEEARVL